MSSPGYDHLTEELAEQVAEVLAERGSAGATVAELYPVLRDGYGYARGMLGIVLALQWLAGQGRAVVGADRERFYGAGFEPGDNDLITDRRSEPI